MPTFLFLKCSDQSTFLDMMEGYFQQPTEAKLRDARPNLHYQVPLLSAAMCGRVTFTACV